MTTSHLELLFPTPVLFTNIERPFTAAEWAVFNAQEFRKNSGNQIGTNTYVLDHPALKNLRDEIWTVCNNFFQDIYKPLPSVELYITQSWLNKTKQGEYHHTHTHGNSIISGSLYIQTVEQDSITYHRTQQNQINIDATEFNQFNSKSWWYPVHVGDISVFPSTVMHGVDVVEAPGTRITLAFNTFVRGQLTVAGTLNELTI
jgi:uncharacterized protein (TIGR02466 family)